ncbi:MAG: hypothetical protein ABSF82_04425 [Candidatus Bathyarchaeia archaeon]
MMRPNARSTNPPGNKDGFTRLAQDFGNNYNIEIELYADNYSAKVK